MTNLQDLLFDVEKRPATIPSNSNCAFDIIATIDGQEQRLATCADRYELVHNASIFPRIEADLEARGYTYTKSYHMIDNARFYAKYILEDSSLAIGKGKDKIKPMISVAHSYNGLTKYNITFGYFRLICTNGLVIPAEGQEDKNLRISGKHTKEILNSFEILWDKLDYFFSIQDTFKKRFEVLTDRIVVNYADRVEEVLNATKVKPSKAQKLDILTTIENEAKVLDTDVNDWLIYNGINAYIFKGTDSNGNRSKAAPEVKSATDSKVLAYMMK